MKGDKCKNCDGKGETHEHDPNDPHINGECAVCPILLKCEDCNATGKEL